MLKLMNSVIILVILCGGLQLSCCENLVCQFGNGYYLLVGTLYQCKVTALDNSFNNMIIDGYTGTHNVHKNDKDVKSIWINGGNTKYIPDGLGSMFNLLGLAIWTSQLVEIRSNDFLGMQNLEYLSLYDNKLTSVPSDAFSTLPKLKEIYLRYNQIKYIGSGAFDQLKNLNEVYLGGNKCVNNNYVGATAITQMKKDLKVNCVGPLSTTTTTSTTTQNPMEVELEALKNEAKEQQHKNEIEMNKLKDELQKEKLENTKVNKNENALMEMHDNVQSKNGNLLTELSALKLDLQKKGNDITNLNNEKRKLLLAQNQHQNNLKLKIQEKIQLIIENNILKNNLTEAQNEQQNNKFVYETMTRKLNVNLSNCEANQQKSMDFNLSCDFKMINGDQYTCETRDLTINHKDMKLTKVIGSHLRSKSNEEVTKLVIVKSSMFYWSKDIFIKFPSLQTLRVQNAQLNEFKKGDFSSAFKLNVLVVNGNNIKPLGDDVFHGTEEHLTEINMNSNQIEKISAETFRGLKQLIFLSLKDNLITEIPLGSFMDIVMLEILILTGNKIKFLDGKMLEFNKRLMTLAVDQNELREVGEEILNNSKMLKDVNFGGNECIDERTAIDNEDTDGRTLNDLIFVIRNCCKNPGEGLNVYNCGWSGLED